MTNAPVDRSPVGRYPDPKQIAVQIPRVVHGPVPNESGAGLCDGLDLARLGNGESFSLVAPLAQYLGGLTLSWFSRITRAMRL